MTELSTADRIHSSVEFDIAIAASGMGNFGRAQIAEAEGQSKLNDQGGIVEHCQGLVPESLVGVEFRTRKPKTVIPERGRFIPEGSKDVCFIELIDPTEKSEGVEARMSGVGILERLFEG